MTSPYVMAEAFSRGARFGCRLTTLSTGRGSVLVMPDRSKRPPIRPAGPRALRSAVAAVVAGALGLAALTGGGTADRKSVV